MLYMAMATPPPSLKVKHLGGLGAAAGRRPDQLHLSGPGQHHVGGLVLVAVRVPADHDGVCPAGHDAQDRLTEDRLAEHGATQDVTDRAVRRQPHLLQLELGAT